MNNEQTEKDQETLLCDEIRALDEIISAKENDDEEILRKYLDVFVYQENKKYTKYGNKSVDSLKEHRDRLRKDLEDLRDWF